MSFLNEVKNLHNIVRKGIRDSSLSLRMTLPRLFTKPSKYTKRKIPWDKYRNLITLYLCDIPCLTASASRGQFIGWDKQLLPISSNSFKLVPNIRLERTRTDRRILPIG